MKTQVDPTKEQQHQPLQLPQKAPSAAATLANHRPQTLYQRQLLTGIQQSPRVLQAKSIQEMMNHSPRIQKDASLLASMQSHSKAKAAPVQRIVNRTGLPDRLKTGIEQLSGYSMDDVKVHYNSPKPAQLQAHAYAQGTDIHLAPGQEKHLPHEAWHVAQQKQGRVKPTLQFKAGVNINDDKGLEKEADVMGAKSLRQNLKRSTSAMLNSTISDKDLNVAQTPFNSATIQRKNDKSLFRILNQIEGYRESGCFMYYQNDNMSDEPVAWKAHIGVLDAKDRVRLVMEVGSTLRGFGLEHKFDIEEAPDGSQFPKFLTIYAPIKEEDWLRIITALEKKITVDTVLDEKVEKGVMSGKITMRHGAIREININDIEKANIKIEEKDQVYRDCVSYTIVDEQKVCDVKYRDKLVFNEKLDRCQFIVYDQSINKYFAYNAIIWKNRLYPDFKKHWNPFSVKLPKGLKTTESTRAQTE